MPDQKIRDAQPARLNNMNTIRQTKLFKKDVRLLVPAELAAGMLGSFLLAALFAYVSREVLRAHTAAADIAISNFIYGFRMPFLTDFMLVFTNFGGNYIVYLSLFLLALLAWKRHVKESVLFVFLIVSSAALNVLVKVLIARPRPELSPLVDLSGSYSFPSGHAMNAFVFYMTLAYLVYHFTRNRALRVVSFFVAGVVVLGIGFSRVYLGVHYPSDILGGYIAGAGLFIAVIVFDKTFPGFYKVFGRRESKKSQV